MLHSNYTRAALWKFHRHSKSGFAGLQRRDIDISSYPSPRLGSTLASGLEQKIGDAANEVPHADQRDATLPNKDGIWGGRNFPLVTTGTWNWPGPDGSEIPWPLMRTRHVSFDLPPPNPIPAKLTMPFLDVLAGVSRFGSPLLSPVGSLVAPVAGGVLGAIAGAVEHRSLIDCTALGVAERAMLAEVSLQAILVGLFEPSRTTPPDDPIVNIVLADMEKQYLDNPINLAGFASTLSPWLMNYGLDIAGFKFAQMLESPRRRTIRDPIVLGCERKPLNGLPGGQENVNKHPAFVEGLLEATLPVVHADEGAFDFLGPLIMKAANATTTLQTLSSDPAWDALTNFRWNLLDILAAGSNVYMGHLTPNARFTSVIRFQRALSADQALSTLMKLPRDKLDQFKVKRITGGRMREERIFDFIKSTLQTIGPYPLEVARRALEQLNPFIHKKNLRRKTSTDVD